MIHVCESEQGGHSLVVYPSGEAGDTAQLDCDLPKASEHHILDELYQKRGFFLSRPFDCREWVVMAQDDWGQCNDEEFELAKSYKHDAEWMLWRGLVS